MGPAKTTAARSRRTHSYSWSSDSSALRPVYQWPDHPESSNDEHDHRTSPTGLGNLYEGDESEAAGVDTRATSRVLGGHPLGKKKVNYDSDSCLTPRSRRTLRRTLSGVTEPWPSVTMPVAKPSLDTIFSPTHEILHPMQSLLLEKSLSTAAENDKPLVSFVTVRTSTKGSSSFTPKRMTQSVDFDHYSNKPKPKPHPAFKLAFPEPSEDDAQDESTGGGVPLQTVNTVAEAPRNIVVIIVDAEKKPTKLAALDWAINVAVQPGDEIVILGVLKHVSSPSKLRVQSLITRFSCFHGTLRLE